MTPTKEENKMEETTMTKEEKQLLLIDLCARLPYGVILSVDNGKYREDKKIWPSLFNSDSLWDAKPYLRPMSSMTEEEREEWADLFNLELDKLNEIDDENKAEELAPYYFGKSHQVSIDWLNKNMFDYRGLIPMGLALESPEGMYKTE